MERPFLYLSAAIEQPINVAEIAQVLVDDSVKTLDQIKTFDGKWNEYGYAVETIVSTWSSDRAKVVADSIVYGIGA
jgi:hypothetical protein